jgi:hypothetical protein
LGIIGDINNDSIPLIEKDDVSSLDKLKLTRKELENKRIELQIKKVSRLIHFGLFFSVLFSVLFSILYFRLLFIVYCLLF